MNNNQISYPFNNDVTAYILSFISIKETAKNSRVSRTWNAATKHAKLLETLFEACKLADGRSTILSAMSDQGERYTYLSKKLADSGCWDLAIEVAEWCDHYRAKNTRALLAEISIKARERGHREVALKCDELMSKKYLR